LALYLRRNLTAWGDRLPVIHSLHLSAALPRNPAFSPDGSRYFTHDSDSGATLWNTNTGVAVHTWSGSKNLWCAFTAGGRVFVMLATGKPWALTFWSAETGQQVREPFPLAANEHGILSQNGDVVVCF